MYFSWGVCKNQCSRDRASFRHCAGNESGRHRRVCVNVLYATPWVLARLKRIASALVRPSDEPGCVSRVCDSLPAREQRRCKQRRNFL